MLTTHLLPSGFQQLPHVRLSRSLFLASVSALGLAHPLLAQETQAADDSVFVLGDITLTVDDVAGYFANGAQATKSAVPISESQHSVSVVTEDQIEDQGARNLGEALTYTAGVVGQPFGIDPRFNNPTLRGFGTEKAQYVNGLRQGRFFGSVDYETYGMQQIEVLRGPSSSLYGANGTFLRGASQQSESSDSISLDTRLSGEVITGPVTHQLLFGADIRKYDADESSLIDSDRTTFNWLNPDNQGPLPVFEGTPNAGSVTLKQVGLYAQDEIVYDNWRGSVGLRFDWAEQTGTQYGVRAEFDETELTGRAGLS